MPLLIRSSIALGLAAVASMSALPAQTAVATGAGMDVGTLPDAPREARPRVPLVPVLVLLRAAARLAARRPGATA